MAGVAQATVDINRALTKLQRMGQRGRARASLEVVSSALNIQAGAKRECPVDKGRLRNSIAVADANPKGEPSAALLPEGGGRVSGSTLAAVVGTNVEYAPFVHFGTRRMRARPFLFRAWEAERAEFLANLRRAMKEEARNL